MPSDSRTSTSYRRASRSSSGSRAVRRPVRENALQVEDRVGRVRLGVDYAPGDAVGRVAETLVVEDAHVGRPFWREADVEAPAPRGFGDVLRRLQLGDVEVRVGRLA